MQRSVAEAEGAVKIVVLDVDKTLMRPDGSANSYTYEAWARLLQYLTANDNVKFILMTARGSVYGRTNSILQLLNHPQLGQCFAGHIFLNQYVYKASAIELIQEALKKRCHFLLFDDLQSEKTAGDQVGSRLRRADKGDVRTGTIQLREPVDYKKDPAGSGFVKRVRRGFQKMIAQQTARQLVVAGKPPTTQARDKRKLGEAIEDGSASSAEAENYAAASAFRRVS